MSQVDSATTRLICGYGRSGTTWVQDVLAESNELRPVFEPLHQEVFRDAVQYAHRYRDRDKEDPELDKYLRRFFSGDFHSLWVDYRTRMDLIMPGPGRPGRRILRRLNDARRNFFRYRPQRDRAGRIVKLIRANMMISWIHRVLNARIVFLIRHPAPVVLSQLRSPGIWRPIERIQAYQRDEQLMGAIDDRWRRALAADLTDVQALTLSWCLENSVALRQCNTSGIPVIFYEHLIENGMAEWTNIVDALELCETPGPSLIARPSQQAWGARANDEVTVRRYDFWQDGITKEQRSEIQEILDQTCMTIYHTSKSLPIRDC